MLKHFTLLLFVILIFSCSNNKTVFDKVTSKDIFGQDIKAVSEKKYDLSGYDLSGTVFYLYSIIFKKGELDRIAIDDKLSNYPSFRTGIFDGIKIVDSNFIVKWKKMPLKTEIDSLLFNSTFHFDNVRKVLLENRANITDSSNFFSCVASSNYGSIFLMLCPKENKMFIVKKNG